MQKLSIHIKAREVPDGLSSHSLARQHSIRSVVLACTWLICFCKKRGSNTYTVSLNFMTKIHYSSAIYLSWKVSCRFLSYCDAVTQLSDFCQLFMIASCISCPWNHKMGHCNRKDYCTHWPRKLIIDTMHIFHTEYPVRYLLGRGVQPLCCTARHRATNTPKVCIDVL